MKIDMLMPQMGESIAEATISKWLKKVGDPVKKDEIILEISTDKVDSEIPAPSAGTIAEILFKEGDVVPVKTKIAVIEPSGSAGATSAAKAAAAPAADTSSKVTAVTPAKPAVTQTSTTTATHATATKHTNGSANEKGSRFYSPLVMSLAEKHGVSVSELETILGSGQGGRVNKQDLLKYVETRGGSGSRSGSGSVATGASSRPSPSIAPPANIDWEADGSKVVLMDNMRQLIADHMVRSKQTSPHVYSIQEVDVTNIAKWRARVKNQFQEREGFNLSFTPFFLEAAVQGLLRFPYINASVDGKKIILKKNINLGCAVALGNSGLIVPVIKKAEEKNFVGLARSLNDLALRARDKKLLPDDITGGTFTVTNPGVFGTIIGTPIINQPQVAILCLGAIKKRPVVIDDMIAIRDICYLTLSYDHRIVDGSLGGQYLAFLRDYLENWDMNRPLM